MMTQHLISILKEYLLRGPAARFHSCLILTHALIHLHKYILYSNNRIGRQSYIKIQKVKRKDSLHMAWLPQWVEQPNISIHTGDQNSTIQYSAVQYSGKILQWRSYLVFVYGVILIGLLLSYCRLWSGQRTILSPQTPLSSKQTH